MNNYERQVLEQSHSKLQIPRVITTLSPTEFDKVGLQQTRITPPRLFINRSGEWPPLPPPQAFGTSTSCHYL